MNARANVRTTGDAKKRVSKIADARTSLAGFDHDTEVDILTFGQFSIIDLVEAVLEITGPASVDLATWTAAEFDLTQIQAQLKDSRIQRLRFMVDRSFVARKPEFVDAIHQRFGINSVRSTRLHAKFVVIRNDEWNVVIRTSMNLNYNPRLEYAQVCDDPHLADFYSEVVDELFDEEPPGLANRRAVPSLPGIRGVTPAMTVTACGDTVTAGPLA